MFLCYASKDIVFVCKVSDFRTKTLGYNLQKIAKFLQNHGVFVNLVQEFTKSGYRQTAFGERHKEICRHNSEVLMMLLTKEKGVPQALANPLKSTKLNPITICQLRKSVKKPNPCPQCHPCLNFCPSPKADGQYYSLIYSFRVSHRYIYSVLPLCPQPSAGTQIKKRNTDTTDLTLIGLSRIFLIIFFLILFWLMILGLGLWIYLDLRVLTHSLS